MLHRNIVHLLRLPVVQGLQLPPRVAPTQVVIINIPNAKLSEDARTAMASKCSELEGLLKQAGVRAECDLRENYSPPWKYNHWEVKVSPATSSHSLPAVP